MRSKRFENVTASGRLSASRKSVAATTIALFPTFAPDKSVAPDTVELLLIFGPVCRKSFADVSYLHPAGVPPEEADADEEEAESTPGNQPLSLRPAILAG